MVALRIAWRTLVNYCGAKLIDQNWATVHCIDDEIIECLQRQRKRAARVVQVPELSAIADIKLNERHSLRRRKDHILITALKTGFDFHDQILNVPW
jgi:hypothetical protein